MKKMNVYNLSKAYGPPSVDLREGMIADDWGDRTNAQMPIDHQTPDDVTREHLDYYHSAVYSYMEDSDLLFYLYPVAKAYAEDLMFNGIDGYMYNLDRRINDILKTMGEIDKAALIEGLKWIWDVGGDVHADWYRCKRLQIAIGVNVSWYC